jgi:hypothetical protein
MFLFSHIMGEARSHYRSAGKKEYQTRFQESNLDLAATVQCMGRFHPFIGHEGP